MKSVAILIFLIVSIGELISITARVEFLHLIFKPLIMVSLGAFYWTSVHSKDRSNVVMIAISFSFLGDTLLLFGDLAEIYFILGLVAFLLSHTFYIVAYRQHRLDDVTNALHCVKRILLALPVVLAGVGLLIMLLPSLGPLKIPVILYTAVILLMVLNALFRYGRTSSLSFWLVFVGAVLFMISDSILAINKFHTDLLHSGLLVMTPYIIAQFLILKGLVKHTTID